MTRRWMAAILLGVTMLASACSGGDEDDGAEAAPSAEAVADLQRYSAAVDLLAKDAGRMVVEEIRPRLSDLREGRITPEQFRTEADYWRVRMEAARVAVAKLRPADGLIEAAELFETAFRQYVDAIVAFSAASRRPTPELTGAISAAIPLAEKADKTYDEADALVQAALARHGLPTRPTLPD